MDMLKVIDGLQTGLDAVSKLAPVVKALGGPDLAALAAMASSVAAIGANVAERIKQGEMVATTREALVIQAINRELAITNDKLAEYIAKS